MIGGQGLLVVVQMDYCKFSKLEIVLTANTPPVVIGKMIIKGVINLLG